MESQGTDPCQLSRLGYSQEAVLRPIPLHLIFGDDNRLCTDSLALATQDATFDTMSSQFWSSAEESNFSMSPCAESVTSPTLDFINSGQA